MRAWSFFILMLCLVTGCSSPPLAGDQLGAVDHVALLKQMQWLNRTPPASFDFGEDGRDGYITRVRNEIIARNAHWSDETLSLIRGGEIALGMSKNQVVASIGWPNEYPSVLWDDYEGSSLHGSSFGDPLDTMQARARANRWTYGRWSQALHLFFDWKTHELYRIIDNRAATGETIIPPEGD